MCIEFAFKRAGIPIVRNFLHQAEGVMGGIPKDAVPRLKIHYKVKTFQAGKVTNLTYITNPIDGFPCKGDKK